MRCRAVFNICYTQLCDISLEWIIPLMYDGMRKTQMEKIIFLPSHNYIPTTQKRQWISFG